MLIFIFSLFFVVFSSYQTRNTCPFVTKPEEDFFFTWYAGGMTYNSVEHLSRTSNLIFIFRPDHSNLESRLQEVSKTGCFAFVHVGFNIGESIQDFNKTKWSWMLPIIEKYSHIVKSLYFADEPFWNHVDKCNEDFQFCIDSINMGCNFIHQTTSSKFPIATTLAYPTLKNWDSKYHQLPTGLDWIGMDCYSKNFSNCCGWSMRKYYDLLLSLTTDTQKLMIVPPAGKTEKTCQVDVENIFSIYQSYFNMVKDIGRNKFVCIMPFLWACDDWYGGKYFPLLGLWWNLILTNNSLISSYNFYLDGLIFGCQSAPDCEKFFPPSVATSINLVHENQIHPIALSAWNKANCGKNYNLKILSTDKITQKLKQLEIGETITDTSPEVEFLRKSCSLNFHKINEALGNVSN